MKYSQYDFNIHNFKEDNYETNLRYRVANGYYIYRGQYFMVMQSAKVREGIFFNYLYQLN